MRLPPFFKDLPNDAVRRVVELLNQPQLVQTVKEARSRSGATTEWGTSQVQDSMRQAKRWLDSMSSRWRASAPASATPVINASGLVFSSDYPLPPTENSANAAYSSSFAGAVDARAVRRELEHQIAQMSNAESALVLQSVSSAVLLLSMVSGVDGGWIIPRSAGVLLPDGADVFAIFRRHGKLQEVGTANSLSIEDFQRVWESSSGAKLGVLQIFPRRLANEIANASNHFHLVDDVTQSAQKLGCLNVEIRYEGALCDLTEIAVAHTKVADRLASGVDIVVFPGDMLAGGPQCAIVVGKKCWVDRLRHLADDFGSAASSIVATMMLGALDSNRDVETWKKSVVGEIITSSLANQMNRAKRIAQQLEGSTLVASASVAELSLPIGDFMWADCASPTVVIDVKPKEDLESIKQQLARYPRKILFNTPHGTGIQIVMRSVDPADDREIVSAFGVFDEKSEPEKSEPAKPENDVG